MKNLFKAVAEFQQEVKTIHKATKGYGYSYADLPTIFEAINPLMKKHGLGFMQQIEGTNLVTTIFHVETGEHVTSSAAIPQDVSLKGMNDFQVLGSAITYMRRYCLSSALGLVTDVDNDAHGEQQPKKKPTMTDKQFQDAIDKFSKGDITKEQLMSLKTLRTLNETQEKSLMLIDKTEK